MKILKTLATWVGVLLTIPTCVVSLIFAVDVLMCRDRHLKNKFDFKLASAESLIDGVY